MKKLKTIIIAVIVIILLIIIEMLTNFLSSNIYSNFITTIMTIATAIMAGYAKKSIDENKENRKKDNQAMIFIHTEGYPINFSFVIKNLGKTPAKNLKINTNRTIPDGFGNKNEYLEGSILSFFPPNTRIKYPNQNYENLLPDPLKKEIEHGGNVRNKIKKEDLLITFNVEYDTVYNEHIREEHILDLYYMKYGFTPEIDKY